MRREIAHVGAARRWHGHMTLACLFDELSYGVLIVSATANLLAVNAAGQRELKRRSPFLLEGGLLSASEECNESAVHTALVKASTGKRSLITLTDAHGACLPVAVVPVVANASQELGAALILSRSAVCDPLMLCFYARSKGLTHAEEVVLGMLGEGKTAPEIAAELQVATSTVRSHIQSLCMKARVTSIRAIMTELARLPPLHGLGSPLSIGSA